MKIVIIVLCLFSASFAQVSDEFSDFAFIRGETVCVSRAAGNKVTKLCKAYDPAISPNGKQVAYTVYGPNDSRHIEIMELQTRQAKILPIDNDNCYGAQWSPDGGAIAFNVWNKTHWDIAVLDRNNTIRVLTAKYHSPEEWVLSSWKPDGSGIIIHDLDTVLILDTTGTCIASFSLHEVTDGKVTSSDSRIWLTSDGKHFVFDGETNDENFYGDGPTTGIFIFDTGTKALKRLSPIGFNCRYPCLTKSDDIYYECVKFNAKTSNIFKVRPEGSKPELILKSAYGFSRKQN